MRISRSLWVAPLLPMLTIHVFTQDAANLPSAPSATLGTERSAAPPPVSQKTQPKKQDSKPAAPVLETLDPKPRPIPQQSSNPPQPQDAASQQKSQDGSGVPPQNSSPTQMPSTADQGDQTPSTVIRSTVNEVNVVFTVTDKHNHYVKELKETDFKVLDNKKPPASIRNFVSETNLPLRVGLLVDASNSIRDRFRFEQQAAIEFLNQIIRSDRDQAFVLGFDTTPEITQDFSGSPEKLANGVRMLRPGGGTAMYDAIYGACRDKLQNVQLKNPGSGMGTLRRAIILLSDGEDNQSRVTRDDAIEEAQRAEVIVYTISTNVSGTQSRGDKILKAIADATGGRAFFPFKIEEVSDAFSQIQEELRSQYAISYKPADFMTDGKYRTIDIEAVNKKYKVRSRKGYFAPRAETASAAGAR